MSKSEHNFWLDATLFVVFLITGVTGFILWLVIPHQLDNFFLGISRTEWIAAHICLGGIGLAGIVIHIVRHWGWLKALRGRSISRMPGKLRANRVVDRILWITFIATNGFGAIASMLQFGDEIYIVRVPDRLHVIFGVTCSVLMIVHLALHWQWIRLTLQRICGRKVWSSCLDHEGLGN